MLPSKHLIATVTVMLVILGAGACSGDDEGPTGMEAADSGAVTRPAAGSDDAPAVETGGDLVLQDADYGASDGGEEAAQAAALPSSGPHVIKTARLGIEVARENFRSAVQQGMGIAEAHGGFVFSSSVKDEKHKRGTVVLRVPSASFETALKDAEALGEVTAQTVTGEDVGEEFIDLRSRLRNAEAQESVLLRLYDRSGSIADTIRIQREVEDVQLQIEQLRGRMRFLENKTSLGTITLDLAESGAPGMDREPAGTLAKAWDRARDAFLAVIAAGIVVVGAILPIALLLALVVLGLRVLRPRVTPSA